MVPAADRNDVGLTAGLNRNSGQAKVRRKLVFRQPLVHDPVRRLFGQG